MSRIAKEVPKPQRIALLGSAPSSVHLAPYGDASWTIWGCSPAGASAVKRVDAWFELHPLDGPDMAKPYLEWMAGHKSPVYLIDPDARIPSGVRYPKEQMLAKYGPYFFNSSLSWMFALALEQSPQEIGLWGVDMAATEEWAHQRPGCHYFITQAYARGIRITVPPESDLLQPPPLYGYCFGDPMWKKLDVRASELDRRVAAAEAAYEHERNQWHFFRGARDNLEYIRKTWTHR